MGNEIHSVPRTETVAFRLSETEKALLLTAQRAHGFGCERGAENQYMRFLVMRDGILVGDSLLVAKVKAEQTEQQKIRFIPRVNWEALRSIISEFANGDDETPQWALSALAEEREPWQPEPPPPVCCREPRVVFVGMLLLCDNCDAELSPRAAASVYRWREAGAAREKRFALSKEFARQAKQLELVADAEDEIPWATQDRLRVGRKVKAVVRARPALTAPVTSEFVEWKNEAAGDVETQHSPSSTEAKKIESSTSATTWERRYEPSGKGRAHTVAMVQDEEGKLLSCCGVELNATIWPVRSAADCQSCLAVRETSHLQGRKLKKGWKPRAA